jgi:hypothetical protein
MFWAFINARHAAPGEHMVHAGMAGLQLPSHLRFFFFILAPATPIWFPIWGRIGALTSHSTQKWHLATEMARSIQPLAGALVIHGPFHIPIVSFF